MIVLLKHTASPSSGIRKLLQRYKISQWIFLSRDYEALLSWERRLNGTANRIFIGKQLDQVARRLRAPFMQLLAEYGRGNDTLEWWSSRISERNTFVSPLFLHCCYLFVTLELVEQVRKNSTENAILVVTESPALISLFKSELRREAGIHVHDDSLAGRIKSWSHELLKIPAKTAYYLGKSIQKHFAARLTRNLRQGRAEINSGRIALIDTWVDNKCLGENGEFYDRYFVELSRFLKQRQYQVITIPRLFNVSGKLRDIYRWFSNSGHFLLREDHLNLFDYFKPIMMFLKHLSKSFERMALEGMDVTPLFDEQKIYQDVVIEVLDDVFFKRLAKSGWNPGLYITTFEYMIPEKIAFRSVGKYLGNTKTIGYQSGASVFPNLLCMFVTEDEADYVPLPDKVVCNGPVLVDIMKSEGMPGDRLTIGPALRYQHLYELARRKNGHPKTTEPAALVLLPLLHSQAIELFHKVCCALQDAEFKGLVKIHPMSKLTPESLWGEQGPSEKITFVDHQMANLLPQVDVMLVMGTSALVEGLAAGVPTILVGSESSLNYDPLDWKMKVSRRIAYTPGEIASQIKLAINNAADNQHDFKISQELIRGLFTPITEETLEAFLI